MEEIYEVVEEMRGGCGIAAAYRSWADPPRRAEGSEPFTRREFPHTHVFPSARLADLYATSSDVASLPAETRAAFLERIRDIARGLPEMLELPSRTVVDLTRRTS